MDYYERVGRALSFIEEHLTDEVDPAAVAASAGSSLYWFHRVFASVVGDSMASYIRKRRLSRAAEELVDRSRRILDIALDYGFGSEEAFTRSFREQFAVTPARYRKARMTTMRIGPADIDRLWRERVAGRRREEMEESNKNGVRVVELPPARMASSEGHGIEEFGTWWPVIDKQRVDRFYPRDFMYYDEGARQLVWLYAVPESVADTAPFRTVSFPGGLYATAVSVGENDVDGERVFAAIKEWVERGGCFRYDGETARQTLFHVVTPERAYSAMHYRQHDIYVPVSLRER